MKCFICGKSVQDEEELLQHIKDDHDDKLEPSNENPDGFTAEQLWYHEKNKYKLKNIGVCPYCSGRKPWNQDKKKYEYYCGKQECKDKIRQVAVNNSMNKYGVENPSEVEENQYKMMEGKGRKMYVLSAEDYLIVDSHNCNDPDVIAAVEGKYKNAAKFVFLSKVEEKTLLGLLKHEKDPHKIKAPMMGSEISYTLPGEEKVRKHIPDIFYTPLNLIVSCKDSILNPNMHPNFKKDRYKNLFEYQAILNNTNYNYIQIEGEEDVANLPKYLQAIHSVHSKGGRYVSPPKVDVYVLTYGEGMDTSDFVLDTFIINEQGFILRNRNSDKGFRLREGILETVDVEVFNNIVYDVKDITHIVFEESFDVYMTDIRYIEIILEHFKAITFEEMVISLDECELLITDFVTVGDE